MGILANPIADPTTDKPPQPRHWIPLSLRTFVALLVILSALSAWLGLRGYRQLAALREIHLVGGHDIGTIERGPSWLRERLGNERMREFDDVTVVVLSHTDFRDAGLASLNELPRLRFLDLGDTQITDAGLVVLKRLMNLTWLNLDGTNISDDGLASLNGLRRLKMLSVERTGVTDAGLQRLDRLTNLQRLFVRGTKVTDAGIAELKRTLPDLKIER